MKRKRLVDMIVVASDLVKASYTMNTESYRRLKEEVAVNCEVICQAESQRAY